MTGVRRLFHGLLNLLYPSRCLFCGEALASSRLPVCTSCRNRLYEEREFRCVVCGKAAEKCSCGVPYLKRSVFPGVRMTAASFYSADPAFAPLKLTREGILRCKKAYTPELAKLMARELGFRVKELLAENGEDIEDWIVTYPPRNGENLLKYGFDHGEMLAMALAELLEIPCRRTLVRVSGRTQKELGGGERYENVKEGFAIIRSAVTEGGKYLLVDDVITTGATMSVAAELLCEYGASAVLPAAVAKTLPQNKGFDDRRR